jgi:hypothetical protein
LVGYDIELKQKNASEPNSSKTCSVVSTRPDSLFEADPTLDPTKDPTGSEPTMDPTMDPTEDQSLGSEEQVQSTSKFSARTNARKPCDSEHMILTWYSLYGTFHVRESRYSTASIFHQ